LQLERRHLLMKKIKIKKLPLFLFLFTVLLHPAMIHGFEIGCGLKGGINISNNSGRSFLDNRTAFYGFTGGVFFILESSRLIEAQIECSYLRKGQKFWEYDRTKNSASSAKIHTKISVDYLEIPLLAKLNAKNRYLFRPYFLFGPAFAVKLRAKVRTGYRNVVASDSLDSIKRADYGLVIGGGVEVLHLAAEARLNFGLRKISEFFGLRNRVFSLLAGYRF